MAGFIYEITARAGDRDTVEAWWRDCLRPILLEERGGLTELDVYRPSPDRDDAGSPRMILYLGFADEATGRAFLQQRTAQDALARAPDAFRLTGELMETRAFAIGERAPSPLRARFSYVVRYELPANDVSEFQAYYMRMHPPILAEFEGIRNIVCYLPRPLGPEATLPGSGCLIGNEVVFDDGAAFDRAMGSPVRAKSRADFETFPPFSGRNPHYPMRRTRILGPDAHEEA